MDCELLAPAGDFETALAAFESGADAVYCGLADFSARAFAKNFSIAELKNVLAYARKNGKKVYVTFNTLLDEDQLDGAIETLAQIDEVAPDGLIVQDLGVAALCRKHFPRLTLHASTQLVAHNLEGVLALRDFGFQRVVLARELSLEEIASIAKRCGGLELECFIHGALCYSLSGLCLFGAMEKGRSGNRGKCPYCCRLPQPDSEGGKTLPFSMKDLRAGEDARKLVEAGVVSLKIEGRMKSPLYVASVTRYYRQILDGNPQRVTTADLETVFSRRTTELYLNGHATAGVIDAESLGHLGTPVGTVKRVTKDRDGLSWLRFHTSRALEKHDGLQFSAVDDAGKHLGMGIVEMRQAISRRPVFEVNAGVDVEILLNDELATALRPGMQIYCSMSNAVKRLFPKPSFRPSDYAGSCQIDVTVSISPDGVTCSARAPFLGDACVTSSISAALEPAKAPERTYEGVKKAFLKLGGTDYALANLTVEDPSSLFVPMSALNDVRRDLVSALDDARERTRQNRIDTVHEALSELSACGLSSVKDVPHETVRIRVDQAPPSCPYDELVVEIAAETELLPEYCLNQAERVRLALPVYTAEPGFNRLRSTVKRFLRAGFTRWECSDLATLKLLKALGVTDLTADWTLYAFNSQSLAALTELGVRRFVASPENGRDNLQYLAESGFPVSFLKQQSTPLFVSLTKPEAYVSEGICSFPKSGLWVTTKKVPRTFQAPDGAPVRIDLSWDPIC